MACMIKTSKEILRLLLSQKKKPLTSGFFGSYVYFLCMRRNQSSDLAFRTAVVKDTHLTLTAIPFKVRANNSLIISLLRTYEKKFAEFLFLFSL